MKFIRIFLILSSLALLYFAYLRFDKGQTGDGLFNIIVAIVLFLVALKDS